MAACLLRAMAGAALLLAAVAPAAPAQDAAAGDAAEAPASPAALVESMAGDDFSGLRASRELAAMGQAALPALVEGTRHDVPRVRYWSVAALSKIGGDRAAEAIKPLLNDPDRLVRSVAVWHLGAWFDRPDVREAVLAKLDDENPSVRGWVLRVVQARRCTEALPAVRKLLASALPEVRYDALHTIAVVRGPQALDEVRQALVTDESPLVRECALRCTTVMEPRTARTGELLILGLGDEEQSVREVAVKLLRKGFGQYFGFDPAAEPQERQKAARQWLAWYRANTSALRWSEERHRFEPAEGAAAGPRPRAAAAGRSD